MGYAAMMVHLEIDRDLEQRIQFALALADRFEAALIGVAGLPLRPALVAGGVAVYPEPSDYDLPLMAAQFDELGKKFLAQGQALQHIEWRYCADAPTELLTREARAVDLLIIGRYGTGTRHDLLDPGAVLLRAGRPVMLVPDIVPPLALRRVVVAWKDTRECRRAVRDALPLLQQAKEVLIVEIGEDRSEADSKKALADVGRYLARHRVAITEEVWRRPRGPAGSELLRFVDEAKADLIVAGGYGHSRLGGMDVRRRHARAAFREPGMLHAIPLSERPSPPYDGLLRTTELEARPS